MPRKSRIFSSSKIYHIVLKGIDDTNLFYSDQDKSKFIEKIKLTKKEYPFKLISYCLMSNHIHLVIRVNDELLSDSMKSLSIRYVKYFNKIYHRKGTLFQNRFFSRNVENQDYFLRVCRYVHRNPEKAGIARTYAYKWSSYNEYVYKEKVIDREILMHYLDNDINNFITYTNECDNIEEELYMADFEMIENLSDEEVISIILKKYNIGDVSEIVSFFKIAENKQKLMELKDKPGISKSQISRKTISKLWKWKSNSPKKLRPQMGNPQKISVPKWGMVAKNGIL